MLGRVSAFLAECLPTHLDGDECVLLVWYTEKGGSLSTLTCPHCGEPIDLIGQKELKDEYGLGPNPVAHARSLGTFPIPVLEFGNRNMWLREQINEYVESRTQDKISRLVEDFEQTIASLDEKERAKARELLLASDGNRRR